ncbi:MAG: hypothetical protein JNL70_07310 [Saprospiraceae bacterium]|nr:hypothetical protein [Saprospiraceae bacterium]
MEESLFIIPTLAQNDNSQRIEQYIRNLQGVLSIQIDAPNNTLYIRHFRSLTRRELSRSLSKLGFPERVTV